MSLFNDKLKDISLKDLLILVIFLAVIQVSFDYFSVARIDVIWIYIFLILFFIFKLGGDFNSFKQDFFKVFTKNSLREILWFVVLNVFISYGMLYISNFSLHAFPFLNQLVNLQFSSLYINNSLFIFGGFITTVFFSPILEELIFRGVLLNKLSAFTSISFSIVISSLLFAFLHSFGSVTSAFIFAICMAILYLKTGNILVPIFAHFLNNLIAECIVILDINNILFTNGIVMLIMSLLAVLCFIFISISIKHQWDILNNNEI
ncbi:lysostaphin resistance A-like protein [Methanobrevibacter sp.]|uniref:lysostaphin resistance A-like protein n=1 Tax=Methanobrevibacter sp. TaxID=66852 RepID=UPI0034CFC34B